MLSGSKMRTLYFKSLLYLHLDHWKAVIKKAPPEREVAVIEISKKGGGYGKIASAMGMTTSMVRRII